HLNVTSLDGLARLMKLLTNYFKDEVGKKLLDHLHQWANTDKLRQASTKTIKDLHEVKILVAILNIFHLLPASAVVLLDDLVTMVVTMETHLMRRESSPFRKPLFLFLNHYPAEAIKYFFDRIDLPHYARMFAEALAHESCRSLRKELTEDPSRLVVVLTSASPAAAAAAAAASVEVAPAKEAGRQPQTKADMDANADKMEVEDAKKEATEGGNDNAAQADGAGVARRPTLRQMHGCLLVEALI
ncbi:transcription-associated protein 1, partial [Spiromyces aspiralis]